MSHKKEKADAPAKDTAQINTKLAKAYQGLPEDARQKAVNRIAKRKNDMPKVYRANYGKAMQGKSLKAATKAFCLECVQWERVEVKLCPSTPCPLWPYRPYQDSSKKPPEKPFLGAESKNAGQGD